MRRTSVSLPLVPLLVLALAVGARAQSGPGVPRRVFDPSELFHPIAHLGTGNHGHSMMFDGWLAVVRYTPGAVDFYDISNPYDPALRGTITKGMDDLSEPHTFAVTTAYGGQHVVLLRGPGGLGGTGFAIWDWTNLSDAHRVVAYDIPGVPGGYATGVFWLACQAPYIYCGAGSLGLYVIDASDPANPFVAKHLATSATGGFNAVDSLVIGNLLILTNSDGGPGMARFDISDPVNPQLVSASTGTSTPYGLQANGGMLLVPAVSGPVNTSTGNGGVFEVRDPSQASFPILGELVLPSRGGDVVVQDGFAHVGASLAYVKIDLSDPAAPAEVGSAANPNGGGDWDWVTPVGNMAAIGDDQGYGTYLVPHDVVPDTTGPEVTMVIPRDGAIHQALTSRVGVTASDSIDERSIDAASFMVRPVGGAALAGGYSSQFGILNFVPAQPLQPNTTYEVVVPAGGLRDWSGNPTTSDFVSRFSTGSDVTAVEVSAQATAPALPDETVTFDVASSSGPGPLQFSWDFGDGAPPTPLSPTTQVTHSYGAPGHYAVVVTATDGTLTGTDSFLQPVHRPLTSGRPARASTIALDETRGRVYCVNPDNDTVTAADAQTLERSFEEPVGKHPRSLAVAPDGTIWVACQDDATVRVLDPAGGGTLETIAMPYASAPFGIAIAPDGGAAYVALRATGEVAKLDVATRTLVGTTPVGPEPRWIAISADSQRVFVTRFISSAEPSPLSLRARSASLFAEVRPVPVGPRAMQPVGEVRELSAASFSLVRTIPLAVDPGPDSEESGRGLPNYLGALAISPDGTRLWVPSKKDDIERGLYRDGLPLTFQNTVRTIDSQIDLATNREDLAARVDFNDRDSACAIVLSPLGDYAFTALQGSNTVDVRDAYTGAIVGGIEGTGLAPQGLVLSSDGARLYVQNFMSRSMTAYDASGLTSSTNFAMPLVGHVTTVASERLTPQVLQGKRIFYDATDPRMNEDGYLSCATCHLDGESDGMTWDFTDRGEGFRNTISMIGHAGTAQGNVHWTANFDEIQDFENDMRFAFGGDGFMPNALFNMGTIANPLGQKKAGLSPELDALAAYVASLNESGESPYRNPDGTLTAAGVNGRVLFRQLNCQQCHSGPAFTDSASGVLHDVGTIKPSSGMRIGGPLTGLDTPTLRGLWATAPYLHDGSAPTLLDVLTTQNPAGQHGATGTLSPQELQDLVGYLLQIDDLEHEP